MKLAAFALLLLAGRVCWCDGLADALRSRHYEEALMLSESLLKSRPADPVVWTAQGLALTGLGREADSVRAFEKALEFAPRFVPALRGAAEVTYRLHDPRAATFLDRLIQLQPENGVAHAMAGVLSYEAHDCGTAIHHFELGREQVSNNQKAYLLYGACLTVLHRPAEAVTVFQRLLADNPTDGDTRFDLGYAQLLAGTPSDAVATLEKLSVDARADTLNLLAAAELANRQPQAAVAHLRQAIGIAPSDEQNYVDLAALYVQNDSPQGAAAVVEAGLKKLPQSARLHSLLGVVRAQTGTFEDAAAEFDTANRLDPTEAYGAAGLGVLYTEANRADLGAPILRERLKKIPADPTLNYLLADTLMHDGAELGTPSFEEARKALAVAIAAKPDFAKAHTLLGKMYSHAGDYGKAVDELRRGVRYDPSDRTAMSQLAIALRHSGRSEEAAEVNAALRRLVIKQLQPETQPNRIRVAHGGPGPER